LQAKHSKLHSDNEEVNENEMRCMCSVDFWDNGTFLVRFWVKSPAKIKALAAMVHHGYYFRLPYTHQNRLN